MAQSFAPLASFPSTWLQRLKASLQPQVLLSSTAAGLVTGIIGVIRAISYASLIFAGVLSVHLPVGLGMAVLSTGIITGVVALTSTLPGMIATPLAAPAAILAILAGDIAAELATAPPNEQLSTVLMAIVATSLLTGTMLVGLGVFRQGRRIRFVPYPVIGGFMAGTGWLLTKGFMQITTAVEPTWGTLGALVQPDMLWCWLPGVGFTLVLLVSTRLWRQFWIMPAMLLACTALFFTALAVTHTSIDAARAAGWLLGPFPGDRQLLHPVTLDWTGITQVHWAAILHQGGTMLTLAFVSLLSLLLSNSSIELVVGHDLDLSNEMKAVGIANLISGLSGGMVGSQAFPSTLLVNEIGASHRLTGLVAVVPAVAVLALGSSFLSYLPKAVLGSLILFLGVSLLWKWLYQAFQTLPLSDYLTVWITLIVIDQVGFLQGIVVGFVLTVVAFMYRYSQIDVARQVSSGESSRSNVERDPQEDRILDVKGSQIYALELHGFLFFGTSNYLLNKVRERVQAVPPQCDVSGQDGAVCVEPLRYAVIDFRQVSGLDSSAVLTFNKILKLANRHHFTLVLTNLLPTFEQSLQRGQGLDLTSDRCRTFPDLDRGLEWCEQQILGAIAAPAPPSPSLGLGLNSADAGSADSSSPLSQPTTTAVAAPPSLSLAHRLADMFLTDAQAQQFMTYLHPHAFPPGHAIFRPGELRPELYFIESGQVSVLLELDDGRTKRLQTCTSGHILGEMRFYNKMPLSSSVITDTDSVLFSLTKVAFEQMQQEAPDLVQALQSHIVEVLCESLVRRGEQLRVMQ